MKKYLLGIDVGTTGSKTILFSFDGKVIGHAYRSYETGNPERLRSEQNPDDWWKAVTETVREVCGGINGSEVAGISLSTQGGTLVPVDAEFNPVRPAIVWSDTRCAEQKELFKKTVGDASVMYQKTGWGLSNGLSAMQIRWMKDNEPENFKKTAMFLSVADYISAKMTGKAIIDISNAGINELIDVRKHKYDRELLDFCGINENQLPPIYDSSTAIGVLTDKAAEELGLTTDTVLSSGAHDQYAVALGAGVINPGDILIGSGTSWAITAISDAPRFESGLSQSVSAVAGRWGSLLSLSAGGVCLEWFRKKMGAEGRILTYKEIDEGSEKVLSSEKGLFFYPFGSKFDDEVGKVTDVKACGTLIGLDVSDDSFCIARAIMEGVVFQTVWLLEAFNSQSETIKLAGGASKSPVWTQILADVTGRAVVIPDVADLACVGAAIMAGVGCGVYKDAIEGYKSLAVNEKTVYPNANRSAGYAEEYRRYKEIAGYLGKIYGVR